MNRNEEIGLRQVRNFSALFEREIAVIFARVNHFGAQASLNQVPKTLNNIEDQIFFQKAFTPNRAQIPTSVTGVEHDAEFRSVDWGEYLVEIFRLCGRRTIII